MRIKGRAYTESEKRAVIERIFSMWAQFPDMRLGQLISNALYLSSNGGDIFYVEDSTICEMLEEFIHKHGVGGTMTVRM